MQAELSPGHSKRSSSDQSNGKIEFNEKKLSLPGCNQLTVQIDKSANCSSIRLANLKSLKI